MLMFDEAMHLKIISQIVLEEAMRRAAKLYASLAEREMRLP